MPKITTITTKNKIIWFIKRNSINKTVYRIIWLSKGLPSIIQVRIK